MRSHVVKKSSAALALFWGAIIGVLLGFVISGFQPDLEVTETEPEVEKTQEPDKAITVENPDVVPVVVPVKNDTMTGPILNSTLIDDFVSSFGFPNQQETNIILEVPERDLEVFTVQYGQPQDCPSGCIFSNAEGLKYNDKVGWIAVDDYDDIQLDSDSFYDLTKNDNYLFTDDFYNSLTSVHDWLDHLGIMQLLAKDPDTPNEVLLKFTKSLDSENRGYLASWLLENPKVQYNKKILATIANLTQYEDASTLANNLLENFGPLPTPKKQLEDGASPKNIVCREDFEKIFKGLNGNPACVEPRTATVLTQRGWV